MAVTQRPQIAEQTTRHPLTPLTADEIAQAVQIVRSTGKLGAASLFVSLDLYEPPKDAVLNWNGTTAIDREAFLVIRDRAHRSTYEIVVNLSKSEVSSWQGVPDVQPSVTVTEMAETEPVIKRHKGWQDAMRKRGITDFDLAMIDPWTAGYYTPQDDPREHRLVRGLTWMREGSDTDNGYARPIEGLVVFFDLDSMEVLSIEDHGVVPLPPKSGNYDPERIKDPNNVPHFEHLRSGLKPLEIVQPEGVSFQVESHEVRWQNWRFRIGWTTREGLVLHQIAYEDRGCLRPICYRASITDLVVPYGDPAPTHSRKNANDSGEFGLGLMANSLELGCDCLGDITYLDAVMVDNEGNPATIKNAICMHEEDAGILWKHADVRTGVVEVRRARRFVISFIATVGNYDYGFYWYLYQDGSIEFETKLTGIISTGAIAEGEDPDHGRLVAPGLYGPNHHHYFSARLDMMVDGEHNSVYEVEGQSQPMSSVNPLGNAWINRKTLLATESEAQRIVSPLTGRSWYIENPAVRNELGQNVAYRLMPGDNVLPFVSPDAPVLRRYGFITKHLWVTRYDPTERYAAGDYVNQHPGGDGLPRYVRANRNLEDTDVVVWYTFGSNHTVRPEDWPVMPVTRLNFHLQPVGFFVGNPALDLPPSSNGHGPSCSHA